MKIKIPAHKQQILALILVIIFSLGTRAQVPPDAGQTSRELQKQPELLSGPDATKPIKPLDIESAGPRKQTTQAVRITVKAIHVTGSSAYPASTLEAIVADLVGRDVNMAELEAAIERITAFYRANFFVVAPPQLLKGLPVSYMTSLFVPSAQAAILNELVRDFPNLVVIDVAQIMAQVQKMMDQVTNAVQFVFLFTLAAGLLVLYAAIASTRDEREYEAAVMRTLGASRRQIAATQFAEFSLRGALAGLLAAAGASALGYALALKVLHVPYVANHWIWLIGVVAGSTGIAFAGMLGARRVLAAPPLQSLRRIA